MEAPTYKLSKTISLDTESTGLDLRHGARPYLVTTCNQYDQTLFWQWPVDPKTRLPEIPPEDLIHIQQVIDFAEIIYLQNSKFDAAALKTIGITLPWPKVRDTLIAGHMVASNHKHNLTDMTMEWLGWDIEGLEKAVEKATKAARAYVKKQQKRYHKMVEADSLFVSEIDQLDNLTEYDTWRLASEDDETMPSVNAGSKRDDDKPWKADMWLLRALLAYWTSTGEQWEENEEYVGWMDLTANYANGDSSVTLPLGIKLEQEIKRLNLWEVYLDRLNLPRIAFNLEQHGVTASQKNLNAQCYDYGIQAAEAADLCVCISSQFGHELDMPAGATPNDSLRELFFGSTRICCSICGNNQKWKEWIDGPCNGPVECEKCAKKGVKAGCVVERNPCFGLEKVYSAKSKTMSPTLDKIAVEHYEATLPPGPERDFIDALKGKRSRDTACSYMESYRRFWLPLERMKDQWQHTSKLNGEAKDWYILFPSFNPVGTDTLRWSSYNPNSTNVSKKEGFNLRYCFGPAPGREWWSMDGKNLELRIPAYESGEEAMIELFEKPNEPPYFGSYHLLNASIVYPDLFNEKVCPDCAGMKNKLKNAEPCSCTKPAVRMWEIKGGFKERYEATWYRRDKAGGFALQYGCGERKADSTFGVKGAYRMLKEKLPKVAALNDRIVAFANKHGYVETIPDRAIGAKRGYMVLASRTDDGHVLPTTPLNYHVQSTAMQWTNRAMIRCDAQLSEWNKQGWDGFMTMMVHDEVVIDAPYMTNKGNLPRVRKLQQLMEQGGDDISVPTTVSVTYHNTTWATGETVA